MSFRHGIIRATTPLARHSLSIKNRPFLGHRPLSWGFLSKRSDAPISRFLKAVDQGNVTEVHKQFHCLWPTSPTPTNAQTPRLDREQITRVVYALVAAGRPIDLALVLHISQSFSKPDLVALIHSVAATCVRKDGDPRALFRWFATFPAHACLPLPSVTTWTRLHQHCMGMENARMTLAALDYLPLMRKCGVAPELRMYKDVIQSLLEHLPSPELQIFDPLLSEMRQHGVGNTSISKLLHDGFMQRGFTDVAKKAVLAYESYFPPDAELDNSHERFYAELREASKESGVAAALRLFQTLESLGCVPSHKVTECILDGAQTTADIVLVEHSFGIQATTAHWAILIGNAVGSRDKLRILEDAKLAGIRPSPSMALPIIRALFGVEGSTLPSNQYLESALDLFRDLPRTSDEAEAVANAEIHELVIRALLVSGQPNHVSDAKTIATEMKSQDITPADSHRLAQLIVLLMNASSTLEEAIKFYRDLRKPLNGPGYQTVLNGFCRLFPRAHSLPITSYLEIIKDMQQAGHNMTADLYINILSQLGGLATKLPQDVLYCTEQVHNHIKLDVSVAPNTKLQNQLLDVYVRVHEINSALTLWETMYLSNTFDHASVSTILHACGAQRRIRKASDVCRALFKTGFMFNHDNWIAWLECLCLNGHLEDAVRMVCVEMGANGSITPDMQHLEVLLKFAGDERDIVLERVQAHQPVLHASFHRNIELL